MRRIDKKMAALAVGVASLALAGAAVAGAINSAIIKERVFNDCPGSTVMSSNLYPASITISDFNPNCPGFANLHVWRLSSDGMTAHEFANSDGFALSATLRISGMGEGEAGLQIRPWWSESDGRINVRTNDGEIACFGGRLPFYNFSGAPHNLHYVKGTPIGLSMVYSPNGLSMASPGTIEYRVDYMGNVYSSGILNFDEGNPAEDPPYGLWGILNFAQAGGHLQFFLSQSVGRDVTAEWNGIVYTPLVVGVQQGTWSGVKGLYR